MLFTYLIYEKHAFSFSKNVRKIIAAEKKKQYVTLSTYEKRHCMNLLVTEKKTFIIACRQ